MRHNGYRTADRGVFQRNLSPLQARFMQMSILIQWLVKLILYASSARCYIARPKIWSWSFLGLFNLYRVLGYRWHGLALVTNGSFLLQFTANNKY